MLRVFSLCIVWGMILSFSFVHCEEDFLEEELQYMVAVSRHELAAMKYYYWMQFQVLGLLERKQQNSQQTETTVQYFMNSMAKMDQLSVCAHALDHEVTHLKTVHLKEDESSMSSPANLISDKFAGWTSNTDMYLNASDTVAEGIIYGTRGGVFTVSLPSMLETKISDDYVIHQVAFDRSYRKVYWINPAAKSIKRANLDGTEVDSILEVDSKALAVDSITGNFYYQNATSDDIRVCSRSGEKCSVLATNQSSVNNIVVHPSKSLMFWIRDVSTVVRANMDGTNQEVILSRRDYRFAVDEDSDRIYWIALDQTTVRSCDLNGNDEMVVLNPTRFDRTAIAVYGIGAYIGRYLFHGHGAINKNGVNPGIIANTTSFIHYMAVYATEKYSRSNPCAVSSPCSHLCVLKLDSFACLCPDDERLDRDNVTCV